MQSLKITGKKLLTYCILQIISLNLQDGFVLHPAKMPAHSIYRKNPLQFGKMKLLLQRKVLSLDMLCHILLFSGPGKRLQLLDPGLAGLACADLLNKWGHKVTLYEKDEAIGGLLRFGIPDFKLDKSVIDRRLAILIDEGLIIKTNCHIGNDIKATIF